MKGYLWVAVLLVLAAGVAACGGDNGANDSGAAEVTQPTASATDVAAPFASVSPAATAEGVAGTPTRFEALRDGLRDRLEAIGDNITVVPDDVRNEILASCRELEEFVEREFVSDVCGAIERAIERGDPGLIDLVLDRLAELTGG